MPGEIMRRADLHTHSTASDGLDSPAALVELASQRGISVFALTDHDTIGGVAEAAAAARDRDIAFIPGVEFSIRARRGETHMLGYGIDIENPELASELLALRRGREERTGRILECLRELGIDVPAHLLARDDPEHAPGRPHVARTLVALGIVESVQDAFDRYLAVGRPAFVPRRTPSAEEAIELIHSSGGLAVLAHPFSVHDLEGQIPRLVCAGMDGLEVYYGAYDQDQRSLLAKLASTYNLLATGGSDYHGGRGHRHRALGSVDLPDGDLESLLNRLK